jgi:hypothetical protein
MTFCGAERSVPADGYSMGPQRAREPRGLTGILFRGRVGRPKPPFPNPGSLMSGFQKLDNLTERFDELDADRHRPPPPLPCADCPRRVGAFQVPRFF